MFLNLNFKKFNCNEFSKHFVEKIVHICQKLDSESTIPITPVAIPTTSANPYYYRLVSISIA